MLQMQCEFLDIFSHNIMNNFTSDDMEVTCKVNPYHAADVSRRRVQNFTQFSKSQNCVIS